MGLEYWISLYDKTEVKEYFDSRLLPKPTDDMISRFEEEIGFKLPAGYIGFIKVFGPGEFAWEYRIKAPGYPEFGPDVDLGLFNDERHRWLTERLEKVLSPVRDHVLRLFYFCRTGDGESIGWDPIAQQDTDSREYAIYRFTREGSLEHIADSFQDFVEEVCSDEDTTNLSDWEYRESGPRLSFDPATIRPGKRTS